MIGLFFLSPEPPHIIEVIPRIEKRIVREPIIIRQKVYQPIVVQPNPKRVHINMQGTDDALNRQAGEPTQQTVSFGGGPIRG